MGEVEHTRDTLDFLAERLEATAKDTADKLTLATARKCGEHQMRRLARAFINAHHALEDAYENLMEETNNDKLHKPRCDCHT